MKKNVFRRGGRHVPDGADGRLDRQVDTHQPFSRFCKLHNKPLMWHQKLIYYQTLIWKKRLYNLCINNVIVERTNQNKDTIFIQTCRKMLSFLCQLDIDSDSAALAIISVRPPIFVVALMDHDYFQWNFSGCRGLL